MWSNTIAVGRLTRDPETKTMVKINQSLVLQWQWMMVMVTTKQQTFTDVLLGTKRTKCTTIHEKRITCIGRRSI
ncbi:hypothetical protein AAAC51_06755 [Priestia megaterium]